MRLQREVLEQTTKAPWNVPGGLRPRKGGEVYLWLASATHLACMVT
jgi:hypothetical protein